MSVESVREYLSEYGFADRVLTFDVSSATVALAAQALGVAPGLIAKTLSFHVGEDVVLVVMAGDQKIDNQKYKAQFSAKAKMLSFEEAEPLIGHAVGGVCPFAVREGVKVYLDLSLKAYEIIYPAAGSAASAVRLTPDELEIASRSLGWVDVCKPMT